MSDAETPLSADWARPLYERQVAMLGRLAEMGMGLAETVEAQVKDNTVSAAEGAVAYGRVARAVRLSLMLQARMIKDLSDRDRTREAQAASSLRRAESDRKARVERIVERIARRRRDDADEVERLAEEASERLDHDDLYGAVLERPVSELVALICKDLGLDPDWPRLAQEAWAREELADEVGWPPTYENSGHPRESGDPGLSSARGGSNCPSIPTSSPASETEHFMQVRPPPS